MLYSLSFVAKKKKLGTIGAYVIADSYKEACTKAYASEYENKFCELINIGSHHESNFTDISEKGVRLKLYNLWYKNSEKADQDTKLILANSIEQIINYYNDKNEIICSIDCITSDEDIIIF
jgi:hypothetical protein